MLKQTWTRPVVELYDPLLNYSMLLPCLIFIHSGWYIFRAGVLGFTTQFVLLKNFFGILDPTRGCPFWTGGDTVNALYISDAHAFLSVSKMDASQKNANLVRWLRPIRLAFGPRGAYHNYQLILWLGIMDLFY
jgi:hypothetical protein